MVVQSLYNICASACDICFTQSSLLLLIFTCTTQEAQKGSPRKAVAQPLLCFGGIVHHLHHQHGLNWSSCALWSGLSAHALLLPGCVLLDGSRSHPVAQEAGVCVQT